jgi:hypothetical protein
MHLSVKLDEHLSVDALFIARKASLNYEGALVFAQGRLEKWLAELTPEQRAKLVLVDCSFCGHRMLPYPSPDTVPPNRVRCYFCDQWEYVTACRSCGSLTSRGDTCQHCGSHEQ